MMFKHLHRPNKGAVKEIRAPLRFVFKKIVAVSDRAVMLWIVLTVVLVVAGGLVASLAPLALKGLIDRLSVPAIVPASALTIVMPVALYVGALALQRLFEQAQTYLYARAEQRMVRTFSADAYAHILALPLSVHLERRSGAFAQALSQGVLGLRLVAMHFVLTIAPVIVQLVVAGVVLATVLDGTLGMLLFGGLVTYCVVFAIGVARLTAPIDRVSSAQVDAGGLVSDGLMNVEAIKAYTAERRFASRYDAMLGATEQGWSQFAWRRLENGIAVAIVFGISFGAILWFAGSDMASGRMTIGAFVLINAYVLQLVRPVEMLGFAIRDIGQGLSYLKEIASILAAAPEQSPSAGSDTSPERRPAELRFEDVAFGYGDRKTIDGVTFTATPGATIGIVGPSGAGKSSLMRLALRFYDPWSGTILLNGVPLGSIPLETLRQQIALVSQDTILFHDTIAANIRFAVDQAEDEEVAAAAGRAHLSALLADLPEGLDTLVGERGLKLSGGEKQRVSIARAVLKQAQFVILDEATAALDPATERAVWTAMRGLSQGTTTLVVTHRLSAVVGADQILVLDRGRIVERGTHRELLDLGGLYAKLWRSQATDEDLNGA
ncbi:ABC transporter ATP-binding protein [Sphingobium sp. LB126]|uniref:ATP-binding cassette domain-containing protein n=1 Tax=Sphingobium sp. LB126 TaxID=1983755 RepID=UPI0012FDC812|nr:ABC transporter ATP-binding protein [Sphingobium sp. LB126]